MTLDIEKSAAPLMWMERWLSEPRLRRYFDVCQGDFARALELYEWNLDLGAALMKDIAYFEVALRNAYDRMMRERYVEGGNWLLDDQSPVNRELPRKTRSGSVRDANALNRKAIKDALTPGRREAAPGSVVAHLPFGFWAHLSDRAHERVLWIPYLQRVWPRGTNRAELDAPSFLPIVPKRHLPKKERFRIISPCGSRATFRVLMSCFRLVAGTRSAMALFTRGLRNFIAG